MSKTIKKNKTVLRNIIKAQLNLSGIPDEIAKEIKQVIDSTKFNKISIPVYCYRCLLTSDDATGTSVVGYVKRYDAENNTFHVVIFANSKETINGFDNPIIYPSYTEYKDKLSVITKLVILPNEAEDDEVAKENAAVIDRDITDEE